MDRYYYGKSELEKKVSASNKKFEKMNLLWPNLYRGKRDGVWQFRFPDGTLSSFYIRCYSNTCDPVMRISDDHYPYKSCRGKFFSETNEPRIELSFLISEDEKVYKWFLDNYLSVKKEPDWLTDRDPCNVEVGKKLSGYFWTKKSWVVIKERERMRKIDEENRIQNRKENHNRA